jgi:NADPH:quinone reductase-like Zn-dependent oxidoreductase
LKSRPSGIPEEEHFEIVEAPVPDPSDGQVLVRNIYLSVDPAMRGWVSAVANYSEPVELGAVMRSLAVGRVEASRNSDFHPGEYVTGMFGWQDYAVVDAEAIERKVGDSGLPISTSLGVLGLNGLTAYFALLDIGQPKAGETVVVSTAAGAVGSCVGQIAKIKGCRTVGIAGGSDKARMCREDFRYDAAVDYKADDLEEALDAACPEGVDVYFDNTAVQSAIRSCDGSMSEHGWSSAARRPSRTGIPRPRDHGSSVIFSSNARECRVFSSLTMSSVIPRHCGSSRAGCATDRSAIKRTSSTESSEHRVRSRAFTAARISASA